MRANNPAAACDCWLEVWELVKEVVAEHDIKDVMELDEIVQCQQSFFNWCQDLEMELGNLVRTSPVHLEKLVAFIQEFIELLPESDSLIIQNMRRTVAEAYYAAGKIIEGENAFKTLISDYPDWAWGYIGWGDMFWLMNSPQTPPDFDRARSIYQKGLDACVEDADEIRERLNDLAEKQKASQA